MGGASEAQRYRRNTEVSLRSKAAAAGMLSADRQDWHRGMESAPAGPRRKRPVHAGIFIEVAFNRTSSVAPGRDSGDSDGRHWHTPGSESESSALTLAGCQRVGSARILPGLPVARARGRQQACRHWHSLAAAAGVDRRRHGAPSCSGEAGALSPISRAECPLLEGAHAHQLCLD